MVYNNLDCYCRESGYWAKYRTLCAIIIYTYSYLANDNLLAIHHTNHAGLPMKQVYTHSMMMCAWICHGTCHGVIILTYKLVERIVPVTNRGETQVLQWYYHTVDAVKYILGAMCQWTGLINFVWLVCCVISIINVLFTKKSLANW